MRHLGEDGYPREAIYHLKIATEGAPDNGEVWRMLAVAYHSVGELDDAWGGRGTIAFPSEGIWNSCEVEARSQWSTPSLRKIREQKKQ